MRLHNFDVSVYTSLETNDNYPEYEELMQSAGQLSWEKLMQKKYTSTLAGLGSKRIYALHFKASFSSDTDLFEDTCKAIFGFFCERFGDENVLSIKALNDHGNYRFHILIFPLRGRIISTDDWVEQREDDESFIPTKAFTHGFITALRDAFQDAMTVDFWTSGDDLENKAAKAEIDLISNMTFDPPSEADTTELIYDAQGLENQYITDMPLDKFLQMNQNTIQYFTLGSEKALYIQAQRGEVTPTAFLQEVQRYLKRTRPDISPRDEKLLLDKVHSAVYGNYILEPLLAAEDISDIKVLGPFHIRVKCNGKRMTSNISFLSPDDYIRYINSLGLRNALDFENEAFHVFTDATTNPNFIMRFNITTPYINSSPFPYLHIRKIRKKKYTLDDLVIMGCMPEKIAEYLRYQINHTSVVFCGKGGSGKTTFMNTLIESISYGSSGLVIQESEELFSSHHPDFMFQHVVHGHGGYGGYDLKTMAQNGLLTDLDYFIIGEIKGGEALYFLNAAMTGHKCVCSVHAPSSQDAVDKLADYVMYESSYDKSQAMYMLKEMKVVVYLENFRVAEISEVDKWDDEAKRLKYNLVYKR